MTEHRIKVPRWGSTFDSDTCWSTRYGKTIFLIWKDYQGPIKEIENTADAITHEFIHLLLRDVVGFSASDQLDCITHFNDEKQECYYAVGGCSYICPIY